MFDFNRFTKERGSAYYQYSSKIMREELNNANTSTIRSGLLVDCGVIIH